MRRQTKSCAIAPESRRLTEAAVPLNLYQAQRLTAAPSEPHRAAYELGNRSGPCTHLHPFCIQSRSSSGSGCGMAWMTGGQQRSEGDATPAASQRQPAAGGQPDSRSGPSAVGAWPPLCPRRPPALQGAAAPPGNQMQQETLRPPGSTPCHITLSFLLGSEVQGKSRGVRTLAYTSAQSDVTVIYCQVITPQRQGI